MIEFENVSFSYGDSPVLDNISFKLYPGESVGLIGANGAGKSTLMKISLGLLKYSGNVTVEDTMVSKENLEIIRKKLGFVLQDSDNQMFMNTVIEDMIFGPINYKMSYDEAVKKAEEVLSRLHIEYLKDKYNHKISGGEKRMAAIATILAMEPTGILMDEPSASLDPKNRRKLINVLNDLKITKLIASHDLDMIMETCTRVLILSGGHIVADGPVNELLRDRLLLEANDLELPFCLAGPPQ